MNFDLILTSGLDDAQDADASATVVEAPDRASVMAVCRADLGTAVVSSVSTEDSLATGWMSKENRRKGKRRGRRHRRGGQGEIESKHLFPWVSDQWTDLKREQKRQNKR